MSPLAEPGSFVHAAAVYASDEEFLAIVLPFLADAVEAGEPVVVAVDEPRRQLIHTALPEVSAVVFADRDEHGHRPASTINAYRKLLSGHVEGGARRIRLIGDVPHPGRGQPWGDWARYEAAAERAFGGFPLWALCPYDTRDTPADVLADVARTHPYLAVANGEFLANPRFEDPSRFLAQRPLPAADPLEAGHPLTDLTNPSPSEARTAVRETAQGTALDHKAIENLIYAVSEAVTNGLCHGRPPVRLRLWTAPSRVVAAISDSGPGPADPFAGLLPASSTKTGGLGLWLAHQLCDHVTLSRGADGFTIRLSVDTHTPAH
ncbi:anti-sigma factor RsbA family regulatory protein [Actinokineospora sp. 24-640]